MRAELIFVAALAGACSGATPAVPWFMAASDADAGTMGAGVDLVDTEEPQPVTPGDSGPAGSEGSTGDDSGGAVADSTPSDDTAGATGTGSAPDTGTGAAVDTGAVPTTTADTGSGSGEPDSGTGSADTGTGPADTGGGWSGGDDTDSGPGSDVSSDPGTEGGVDTGSETAAPCEGLRVDDSGREWLFAGEGVLGSEAFHGSCAALGDRCGGGWRWPSGPEVTAATVPQSTGTLCNWTWSPEGDEYPGPWLGLWTAESYCYTEPDNNWICLTERCAYGALTYGRLGGEYLVPAWCTR